jgi:hypothetical protein
MKRIVFVVLLMIGLFLFGCQTDIMTTTDPTTTASIPTTAINSTDPSITTTDETGTTESSTTTIPDPGDNLISLDRVVDVIDLSYNSGSTIHLFNIYSNSEDTQTAYVNIESFLILVKHGLVEYTVTKTDILSVEFDLSDSNFGTLTIEFDANNDTIHYDNFDLALKIDGTFYSIYDPDLELVDFSTIAGNIEKTIDLKSYAIDIVEEGGKYYIPLYLANLILTGFVHDVYLDHDELYVFNDPTIMQDFFNQTSLDDQSDESALVDQTVNFTALLFDNFYGLSSETGITDFVAEFEDLGFYDYTSIERFDAEFIEWVYYLNDLHTGFIDWGYHNQPVAYVSKNISTTYADVSSELVGLGIQNKDYNIMFAEGEDFYYLDILTFDTYTNSHLADYFENIDPSKDIYIDVGCNLGGTIIAVFELLSYMTDEPLHYDYMNPVTNTYTRETYQVTPGRALSNDFIIFASGATFSAANLFVSIVQENNLGIVIGRTTAGGAAAVDCAILPNNMVIRYSSNIVLTDQERNSIEEGVTPMIVLPEGLDFFDAFQTINEYFSRFGIFSIDSDSTTKDIELDVNITTIPDLADVDCLTVNVYDASNNSLLDSFDTDLLDFMYEKHYDEYQTCIKIEVVVKYRLLGLEFEEVIFSQEIGGAA